MGATQSLEDCTKENIGSIVASYGAKFQQYEQEIVSNGIDGAFLFSMRTEDEFLEALDDLEITQRLHRKKLLREWTKATGLATQMSRSRSSASSCSGLTADTSEAMEALELIDAVEAENAKLRLSWDMLTNNSHRDNSNSSNTGSDSEGSRRRSSNEEKMRAPPEHEAVIVMTDIEGSTNLWEANPLVMRQALNLHDKIMRHEIAKHAGYEITTEGDAFSMAFHEATDALNFSMSLQLAMNAADWDAELLSLPWARQEEHGRRGLRVRVSMHMGPVKQMKDFVSDRISYSGPAVDIAKSIERLAMGGQIIASMQTWEAAAESELLDSSFQPPSVALLGNHQVEQKRDSRGGEPTSISVLEVAPPSLKLIGTTNNTQERSLPPSSSSSAQPPSSPASSDWLRGMLRGVGMTTRVA